MAEMNVEDLEEGLREIHWDTISRLECIPPRKWSNTPELVAEMVTAMKGLWLRDRDPEALAGCIAYVASAYMDYLSMYLPAVKDKTIFREAICVLRHLERASISLKGWSFFVIGEERVALQLPRCIVLIGSDRAWICPSGDTFCPFYPINPLINAIVDRIQGIRG